ncbi:hypothetical protein N8J89_03695 [Crossiella sp. CA-258035]|uniref:hypothetical protein n=1 Tax=Crossiella sp. CA-258035 TaxID=2981138 RepID=UPI0024BC9904|nr:hypothetical protein [Crossiella sp. CA-258035]WHT20188.1 hypothetical protein N8J89_03695 [Crossiella sp. CA-258035]
MSSIDAIGVGTSPGQLGELRHQEQLRRPLFRRAPDSSTARLATVWPAPNSTPGTGPGDWLLTMVVKIVTTYTRPGHRVLLLAPPRTGRPPASTGPIGLPVVPTGQEYDHLLDACWAVFRLGRTVRTHDEPGLTSHPPDGESSAGLAGSWPAVPVAGADAHGQHDGASARPATAGVLPRPDVFELIITAVSPAAGDHRGLRRWASRLAEGGVLAVITHSDHISGGFHDPTRAVVRATAESGLDYLDHLALLRTSARNPGGDPAEDAADGASSFADLLIFSTAPTSATTTARPGDLR